ncbi:MAG: hypothetical protein NTX72_01220 [Candidatus Uhrbacteria bacterium]|nr:hypothetical protein [Candidatus Uhrbacteria bacterium]
MALLAFIAGCFAGSIMFVVACGLLGYRMMRSVMKGQKPRLDRPDVKYTFPNKKE